MLTREQILNTIDHEVTLREHEVARRLPITITFFSCLVVFGVFAFLLASAQVMYTSHKFRFIYLFRSYVCIFTLCAVYVVDSLGMVHWLPKSIFFLRSEHEVKFSNFA